MQLWFSFNAIDLSLQITGAYNEQCIFDDIRIGFPKSDLVRKVF